MVFPRKAGFGRCYLVSKRYEILSNIDRNLTGTRLRLRKTEINKCRESANPIPVLLLSFESQTVVFQLFDFHLRKFKKFIIKKFHFRNQHSTWQWLVVGEDNWAGSDPHRFPLFTEIGRIFHHKYISLVIKMLSKLKSGKCWTRLASYPLQYGNWPWWNNPPICKDSSEENGTGQYAEPQERGL